MKSKGKIATWWQDKFIDKETFEIVSGNEIIFEPDRYELIIVDIGEPECWACGKQAIGSLEDEKQQSIIGIWNSAKGLERCHILSKQFGEQDEEQYYFLMCSKCHFDSPDTKDKKNFFQWVIYRRHHNSFYQQIQQTLKETANMKGLEIEDLCSQLEESEPSSYKVVKMVVEKSFKSCALHGQHFSMSSVCAGIIDELVSYLNEDGKSKNE